MGFPSQKELERVRKKLQNADGMLMLPHDPTTLEKFRWELCQKFVEYKREHGVTHEKMGRLLGVDKGKISKILRHRINEFSTDRLIQYLQVLYPETRLKVG